MKTSFFRIEMLCLMLLLAALLLSGCRVRTTGISQSAETKVEIQSDETGKATGEIGSEGSGSFSDELDGDYAQEFGDFARQTIENSESNRKEYDAQAEAEIAAGAEHLIEQSGIGTDPAVLSDDSDSRASVLDERAEQKAIQTVPSESSLRMGISEDAKAADTAMNYYKVLLEDRLSSLFECKRLNVYWETADDHVTVYKTSLEHQLILESGCYDVSARLTEERLLIDDGWVVRKNPDVIVKVVDPSVLGSSVHSTARSAQVRKEMAGRQEWQKINAVQSEKLLLISSEMLEAPYLQLCIRLAVAKMAYPDLMQDVEIDEALQMLSEEATNILAEAEYFDFGE